MGLLLYFVAKNPLLTQAHIPGLSLWHKLRISDSLYVSLNNAFRTATEHRIRQPGFSFPG
jgi:hypothetical protein